MTFTCLGSSGPIYHLRIDFCVMDVDATEDPEIPSLIQKLLTHNNRPVLLLINKVDLLPPASTAQLVNNWQEKVQVTQIIPITALKGLNVNQLLQVLLQYLPEHHPYYPPDSLTDRSERFLASSLLLALEINPLNLLSINTPSDAISLVAYANEEVPSHTVVKILAYKKNALKIPSQLYLCVSMLRPACRLR